VKQKESDPMKPVGPFKEAKDGAYRFGLNLMYAAALEESLRLIEDIEREYEEAIANNDYKMIDTKKRELDYCLSCLEVGSIVAASTSGIAE
tara:strand:- start:225 stop:497 length:273 start_codon:yes stop_codon:yes gene_type:complete